MPENPAFRRVDATTNYQKDLDLRLSQQYPLVDSEKSEVLSSFREHKTHFVSFGIGNQKLARQVLEVAIQKASDSQNGVAFSTHGSEHAVYQESLSRLQASLSRGKAAFGFQTLYKDFKCGPNIETKPIQRLVVQGERYQRKVLRPVAHQFAKELSSSEKVYKKEIRQAARDHGMAFGLLVCLYKGLDAQEVFDTLGNKDFRNSLEPGTRTFHVTHEDDKKLITRLSKSIIEITSSGRHPIMSSDSYYSAIEILREFKWNIPESITGTKYGFIEAREQPFPRAVFAGMTQVAQEQASSDFKDPARTEYIYSKYENIATTRLVTSFLVFDK